MLIYWAALILIPKVDDAARYMATQWGNLAPIVTLLGHFQKKNMKEKNECNRYRWTRLISTRR